MATSTIPAFKSALVARLQANTGLADCDVTYGYPSSGGPGRDWVLVAGAKGSQETAAMGQRRREETWDQDIVVSVVRPLRETQSDVTERAFAIAALIEDSLRTWSALPGPVFGGIVREALVVGMDLAEHASDDAREAQLTITVACSQRI